MPAHPQSLTRVYIRDHLAADQISEEVRILIDSREAGRLSLDRNNMASVIPVDLDTPGQHRYALEVTAIVRSDGGPAERKKYGGEGTFMASPDRIFRLAADRTGDGWKVHLETDQDEQEIDQ